MPTIKQDNSRSLPKRPARARGYDILNWQQPLIITKVSVLINERSLLSVALSPLYYHIRRCPVFDLNA